MRRKFLTLVTLSFILSNKYGFAQSKAYRIKDSVFFPQTFKELRLNDKTGEILLSVNRQISDSLNCTITLTNSSADTIAVAEILDGDTFSDKEDNNIDYCFVSFGNAGEYESAEVRHITFTYEYRFVYPNQQYSLPIVYQKCAKYKLEIDICKDVLKFKSALDRQGIKYKEIAREGNKYLQLNYSGRRKNIFTYFYIANISGDLKKYPYIKAYTKE